MCPLTSVVNDVTSLDGVIFKLIEALEPNEK